VGVFLVHHRVEGVSQSSFKFSIAETPKGDKLFVLPPLVIQRSETTKNLENTHVDAHEILPPYGRLDDKE
jgi:hypothetical protein